MVDVPRRDPLVDPTSAVVQARRIRNGLTSMTPRGNRGASLWASPVQRRDILRAGARSIGGTVSQAASKGSKIDTFAVTDTGTDTFTLTYKPVKDSWNVRCGWYLDEVDYTIDGRTLTILDPGKVFIGASGTFPKTLRVQYDRFTGFLGAPVGGAPAVFRDKAVAEDFNPAGSQDAPAATVAGDLLVLAVICGQVTPTPSGWTPLTSVGVTTGGLFVFTRIATGSDTATWTYTGYESWASVMIALEAGAAIAATATDTAAGTSADTPALSGSGLVLDVWGAMSDSTTASADPALSELFAQSAIFANIAGGVETVTGSAPTRTGTLGGGVSGDWGVVSLLATA